MPRLGLCRVRQSRCRSAGILALRAELPWAPAEGFRVDAVSALSALDLGGGRWAHDPGREELRCPSRPRQRGRFLSGAPSWRV